MALRGEGAGSCVRTTSTSLRYPPSRMHHTEFRGPMGQQWSKCCPAVPCRREGELLIPVAGFDRPVQEQETDSGPPDSVSQTLYQMGICVYSVHALYVGPRHRSYETRRVRSSIDDVSARLCISDTRISGQHSYDPASVLT